MPLTPPELAKGMIGLQRKATRQYIAPISSVSERRAIRNTYSTALMSNTKWRRVFLALEAVEIRQAIFQFYGAPSEQRMALPSTDIISDRYILDSVVGPYPYYPLIWLEIPAHEIPPGRESFPTSWHHQELDAARRALAAVGRLPLSETDRGFRISGYAA